MSSAVGIIGGADGPTAVFVTGGVSYQQMILGAMAAAVFVMLVSYFALYRRGKGKAFSLLISGAAIVFADQYVKLLSCVLQLGETAEFLPPLLTLTRVHNYGAAWSSFSGTRWLLVIVTAAGMGALVWVLFKIVRHPLGQWALTAVVAGGIGNLIDRVRLGYVIDMFDVMFMNFPVFNAADCFVVVGTAGALVYYLKYYGAQDAKNWEKTDGTDASQDN